MDLNSSLESFRGAFLSTTGRLLANAASVFEALQTSEKFEGFTSTLETTGDRFVDQETAGTALA